MKIALQVEHARGATVYLVHDSDGLPRLVTAYVFTLNGLMYRLACGSEETEHYPEEVTGTKPCF